MIHWLAEVLGITFQEAFNIMVLVYITLIAIGNVFTNKRIDKLERTK